MSQIPIPSPGPDKASDELTSAELIANMSPTKRSIYQYEREIEFLKEDKKYFTNVVNDFREENTELIRAERDCNNIRVKLGECRRSKLDMFITFSMGSCLVAIGGGLVGSFPATAESTPWQHEAGWFCIILGSAFPFLSRLLIQFFLRHLPRIADEWMQ